MTKYILIGGYPWKAKDDGKALCEDAIKGFNNPINFLFSAFAQPAERWTMKFDEIKNFFSKNLPKATFNFVLADSNDFIDQLKQANIIYFSGGNVPRLLKTLQEIPYWTGYLQSKTVIGSSAGTDMLTKYHYNVDDLQLANGLSILPFKTLVHYRSDYNAPNVNWDKAYNELKNHKEDIDLITLQEGEFKVFERN